MNKFAAITLSVALSAMSVSAFAGDAAAGKAKSGSCAGCHGQMGKAGNPVWPNLAGQNAAYLVKQLKDFKSGARKDPMMAGMAAALSDADMDNLAAYYSGL